MGILTAACLCLALGQNAGNVNYTNQRSHEIPVNVDDALLVEFREFRLFASTDQGRSWGQVGAIQPSKKKFIFHATSDGTYWFQVATVNRQGVQTPDEATLMSGAPHMKMEIDTVRPIVKSFQAQRQGDEVFVAWDLQEKNPDPSEAGLRLEYHVKDELIERWTPIKIQAVMKGQISFNPGHKQPLVLRLSVRDLAGNQSYGQAEVAGTIAAAGFNAPAEEKKSPELPLPKFPEMTIPKGSSELPKLPIAPMGDMPKMQIPPPSDFKIPPPGGVIAAPPTIKEPASDKVLADSHKPSSDLLTPASLGNGPAHNVKPASSGKPLPMIQYLNQHSVKLQYEIKRHGPSGVGGVEIWLTRDDGASWDAFARLKGASGETAPGLQDAEFEFIDEYKTAFPDGVYGLNLVVKNRAGLGHTPRAGDVPQMRIEIDTEKPHVKLVDAGADPQNPGQLLLKWYASDKNLTATPIQLEYAEKADGPWLPIKLDLPNTGRSVSPLSTGDYSWKVPAGIPVQVYLRVRARDKAGNEGVAATAAPQYVDLVEPEGALIGVVPQGKR